MVPGEGTTGRADRLGGGLLVVGAVVTALGYALVPIDGGIGTGADHTLLGGAPTFGDVGTLGHALLVGAVGVAAVAGAGRHLALAAAPTLPWTASLAAVAVAPGFDEESLLGIVVGGGTAFQARGVLVALVKAVAGLRPRLALLDGAAVVVALGGLWLAVGLHWYRITDGRSSLRLGSLLEGRGWPVGLTWTATGVASLVLVVAVLRGGTVRRVAAAGLVAVLVLEAVRRGALFPHDWFGSGGSGSPLFRVEVVLPLIALPLVGAAGAAYLGTTEPIDARDPEAEPAELA